MARSAAALIDEIAATRARLGGDPSTLAALQALQKWQVARLEHTYADLAADPRFASALQFFIRDLYGPHDYTQRDRDLKKVLHQWERLLPRRALRAVVGALELEALTLELDATTLDALHDTPLDAATYADAYRRGDRRRDRLRQISLILLAGRELDALIHLPGFGMALRTARVPARLMGVNTLQDFLERGYEAFRRMGSAAELLRIIQRRETTILKKLFAAAADPFVVDDAPPAARTA